MAAPQNQTQQIVYTEDEYFQFAETAEERWEFLPNGLSLASGDQLGIMRAMNGGTDDHAVIISNVIRVLGNALVPNGCRVYASDMRVHTGDGINTFPDVAVVCGPRTYHCGRTDAITNPLVIVEVLSPSTAGYDFGDKFAHYQTIPSLVDYLLVAQDKAQAILHSRSGDHWELRIVAGMESVVTLPSVEVALALADVYALIEFSESDGPNEEE